MACKNLTPSPHPYPHAFAIAFCNQNGGLVESRNAGLATIYSTPRWSANPRRRAFGGSRTWTFWLSHVQALLLLEGVHGHGEIPEITRWTHVWEHRVFCLRYAAVYTDDLFGHLKAAFFKTRTGVRSSCPSVAGRSPQRVCTGINVGLDRRLAVFSAFQFS